MAAKNIPASGAGAARIILKNKQDFHFDLRRKEQDGEKTNYLFDVFYGKTNGTLTIVTKGDEILVAALNLSLGKVINLMNDGNMRKLAEYVLGTL